MKNKVIINLPVSDLKRSVEFFRKLGFESDKQFSGKNTHALSINDMTYVMLFNERFFSRFSEKKTNKAADTSEVVISISVEKPDEVEKMVEKAILAGGSPLKPYDLGWGKGWGFTDPDMHIWEVLYVDRSKVPADKGIRDNEIEFHYEYQWY